MDKPALIQKIKALDSLTNAEKSDLIDLLNNTKKYGLVWEDKPEDVERDLLTMLPVLQEVPERRILAKDLVQISSQNEKSKPGDPTLFNQSGTEITTDSAALPVDDGVIEGSPGVAPNHILIEGDNLHALTALSFTHEGQIDLIYIDPPYNTGNKDFKYHDAFKDEPAFIDKEHPFRHSTWLSFISKRLELAQRLLMDSGFLFISIDDNELNQLKLLSDKIFGQLNFIALLPTIMNLKGNQDQFGFAGTHEYTLVYCKSKNSCSPNQFSFDVEEMESWDEDEIGLFKKGAPLRATGAESNREDRPLMFYPILIDYENTTSTITKEEHFLLYNNTTREFDDNYLNILTANYRERGFDVVLPIVDENNYGRWRWGFNDNTIDRLSYDVIVSRNRNGISLYKKQRPELGELPSKKPKSIFYKPEYSSGNGTAQLKEVLGEKLFNNPKPINLIKDFLIIGSNRKSTILDFFAGSGTTLHATMKLNKEDGGNRQCILVTNNENKICEEVTYERNKRVIKGYTNANGVLVPGLTNNNLRYYKTGFVPSAKTEVNRRLLTSASTELLQIKEDCYNDVTTANGFEPVKCCICTNGSGKYLVVIFHSRKQHEVVEQLCAFIQNISDLSEKVKVYAFSSEKEVLAEDFYSIADKINAVPLPDAIYNAYRATFKILKLEKKSFRPASPAQVEAGNENPETSSQSDLFEQNGEEQP